MSALLIVPLHQLPEAIDQLASWHHDQWGHWNPLSSVLTRTIRLRDHLTPGRIPLTLVAHRNGDVVGSASLVSSDLAAREELSPWLASAYVKDSERRRGIGALLVQAAIDEARRLEFTSLYLFTPDQERFYQRLGWTTIDETDWQETPVVIMRYEL